jgi:hypothetical protein
MERLLVDPQRTCGAVPHVRAVNFTASDPPLKGEPFEEPDIALVAQSGFGAIRLAINDPAQDLELAEQPYQYPDEPWQRLDRTLDWCARHGLQAILDVHNCHGRNGGRDVRLWQERSFQDRLAALWTRLAQRYAGHPAVMAYEFINEPQPPGIGPDGKQRDYAVWNDLARRLTEVVRRVDDRTTLILDSIGFANVTALGGLEPSGDPNTVYSFHTYAPGPFHSQGRPWNRNPGVYQYPGDVDGRSWDRPQLAATFEPALAFRRRHRVPIFCGEFGCVSTTPPMTDLLYLLDQLTLFHRLGFHWAMYNFATRTSEPYWREHFDCNLYIWYTPEQRLITYRSKVALLEHFARETGRVLDLPAPPEGRLLTWHAAWDAPRLSMLVANKHADEDAQVHVGFAGAHAGAPVSVERLDASTEGFGPAEHCHAEPAAPGEPPGLALRLPPRSIVRLRLPRYSPGEQWQWPQQPA